jgi:integration host factor subunit alpha
LTIQNVKANHKDHSKKELSMTLTKALLIEAIAESNGFTKNRATDTIESLLEIMKRTLESGEDFLVS